MKKQFAKLIDLKSIITFMLIATLVFLIIFSVVNGVEVADSVLFILFSNTVTMVVTYFFTKKKELKDEGSEDN